MRRRLKTIGALRVALLAAVLTLGLGARARAADLKVLVVSARGQPVSDAVVLVRRPGGGEAGPIHFPWPMVVEQRDMQFRPFVLIVPVGSEVSFPNHDPFKHHVYSFSPAKTFELKLYGHDDTRRVRFDRLGVVSLGCNIHDDMSGFIRVVDTPYAAKTDVHGEALIHGVPAGPAKLAVWHPYLRDGHDLVRDVTASAGGSTFTVTVDLKPAPMRHGNY
ncbi:methylamine utilization protein [Phenylobacterium sp.]|uniref:methylamine utilization protein n=1 Tax=Phenylobacterium sp. TaxID=1871053 RepID=UPI002F41B722